MYSTNPANGATTLRNIVSWIFLPVAFAIGLSACGPPSGQAPTPEGPTAPFPTGNPALLPISELTITVRPPAGTATNADIALILLDEVTGWAFSGTRLPLKRTPDGLWTIKLTPPAGTLLRYKYVLQSVIDQFEAWTDGSPIVSRVLYVSGNSAFEDLIAAWGNTTYQGPTGRITGRLVDAESGQPLKEMIAVISGQTVFSDSSGEFGVDGLLPGLHTITVFSPDGAYSPAQQGAIVDADSTTPAQMELHKANRVQVTFEVTVPNDTIEGTPIRFSGNLFQLGHIFTELPNHNANSLALMPTIIEVDPTHYILILELYVGTDLRYKYTLGDGVWNAERDVNGNLVTRQIIIPDHDLILRDSVVQWQGSDQESKLIWLTVPEETPKDDLISIQFDPSAGSTAIPMWRIGDYEWFYALHSGPGPLQSIQYRYCRNQLCGAADDAQTSSPNPRYRTFPDQDDARDSITAWSWMQAPDLTTPLLPPQIIPRENFEVGVEIVPRYEPLWETYFDSGLRKIAAMGANTIIFTPSWVVKQSNPIPVIKFDPAYAPFRESLLTSIRKAQSLGLEVILHPSLIYLAEESGAWWLRAVRDESWWNVWYEGYRSFILYYTQIAAETGVTKIVLGENSLSPALPDGLLFDGSPSGSPLEANARWRRLVSDVRNIYGGRLAFELEFSYTLQEAPEFIDLFDEIHIYWRAPLASSATSFYAEIQEMAQFQITNAFLNLPDLAGKSVSLSVEYASVDGGALGCSSTLASGCNEAQIYDFGFDPDPFLAIDMQEQAEAIYALLFEAYAHPDIQGFFVRRYNPIVALQDKSASVNGKIGSRILEFWYAQISQQP